MTNRVHPRRWGMTVPLNDGPLHTQEPLIRRLEELGYTDLWSAEAMGVDGMSPLLLGSQWAPSMRLGTAILPAFTRGPALMAQTVAGMCEAAPGRFVLGLGTSSNVIVENWNAVDFEEPYKRTRDMVRFLRQALTGEKVTETYDTFEVKGFRLHARVEEQPKILVAALREGMLRMAGRESDGAILNWLAPDDLDTIAPIVREQNPDAELAARIFVVPTEDAEVARGIGRFLMGAYINVPVYRAFHEWMGRTDAMQEHWDLWAAGDRKAAMAALPDSVVDELVVHGSGEQCKARIMEYMDKGVDTAAIAVVMGSGTTDAEAIEMLAR
ncbi:MAG: LLM class F420-dependent oxidoreductase [Acidimicrobiales bacterium]|nr:LLM class F420-dependent oxidoreductase [Acidimicrobiales bacterium]RZV47785.1 MAG: LLM class F420-dependent oxidoreductase [Acidimicrobiales bacterium]